MKGQLIDAMRALKYDEEDSPEEKASQAKADGNRLFKYKRYREAVLAYSEGLNIRCADAQINGILLANRGAAQVRRFVCSIGLYSSFYPMHKEPRIHCNIHCNVT